MVGVINVKKNDLTKWICIIIGTFLQGTETMDLIASVGRRRFNGQLDLGAFDRKLNLTDFDVTGIRLALRLQKHVIILLGYEIFFLDISFIIIIINIVAGTGRASGWCPKIRRRPRNSNNYTVVSKDEDRPSYLIA